MKNIVICIVVMRLLTFASAVAQSLSVTQTRQFNLDVLRTLESYEFCSSLYNNSARMDFEMLFPDRKMHIFNDLNGLSAAPTLSVADYSELLGTKGRSTQVIIKNLRKEAPYFDNGWKMKVTFDKEITYANVCEILFSSKNFFGADFHIEMTLAWDEGMRTCTICKLEGSRGSDVEMLPKDYSILTHTSNRDFQITADGKSLSFNSFGQVFLSANPTFSYPDPDVRVRKIVENAECNTISLQYRPKRWRVKPHFDFSIGEFYKGKGNIDTKSSAIEFGVDFGYIIPTKSSTKWGIFFGAIMSQSKMDMSIEQSSYQYQASPNADIDGDSYTRFYSVRGLSQRFKTTDIVVPLYMDVDILLGNSISLYLDAGAKVYYNLKTDSEITGGTYSTYGYYPQYGFEMHADNQWSGGAINGFVEDVSAQRGHSEAPAHYKDFSLDVFGRGGVRYQFSRNCYFDLSLSYQQSVISPFDSDASYNPFNKTSSARNALMSYTLSEGESVKHMTEAMSELKRSALKLSVGLVYRF